MRRFGVVLLLGIDTVVNEGECTGSASAELGLQTKDCDDFFLDLKNLSEFFFDLDLSKGSRLFRVDDLNRLQASQR